jgi:hypothetical protein
MGYCIGFRYFRGNSVKVFENIGCKQWDTAWNRPWQGAIA